MVGIGEDEMEQDMHWRVSGVPLLESLRSSLCTRRAASRVTWVAVGLPASPNALPSSSLSNDACNRLVGRHTYVVSGTAA